MQPRLQQRCRAAARGRRGTRPHHLQTIATYVDGNTHLYQSEGVALRVWQRLRSRHPGIASMMTEYGDRLESGASSLLIDTTAWHVGLVGDCSGEHEAPGG